MIDDALLRPGRLEVHVEIGLPDEAGRLQILNIHTRGMVSQRQTPPPPPRVLFSRTYIFKLVYDAFRRV